MIHRDDLAGLIIAALERGEPAQIYNASDDQAVKELDFFKWLSERLNKPMPPRVDNPPERVRKRAVTNKRVSNEKVRRELGYQLRYPTFREGYLAEILRSGLIR